MSNDFLDSINRGISEAVGLAGEQFTYKNVNYKGIIGPEKWQLILKPDGLKEELARTLLIQKSVISVPLVIGARVIVEGKNYRIEEVRTDKATFEVTLQTATA